MTLADPDTDSDGMPDWWEMANGLDPLVAGTAALGNPDWMERVSRGLPLHAAPFTAAHLTEVGFTPSALDYLAGMGVLAPRDAA